MGRLRSQRRRKTRGCRSINSSRTRTKVNSCPKQRLSQREMSARKYFSKPGEGSLQSVFGSDRKYWSAGMKQALGLEDSGGFPYQLSPLGSKVSLPIPAEPFEGKAPSLKKIFNAEMKIYVTPEEYFKTKFREIFQKTKLRHTSGAESHRWLRGPDMKYWPQQLNFAVFCATQGCGVSREIFASGVRSFTAGESFLHLPRVFHCQADSCTS